MSAGLSESKTNTKESKELTDAPETETPTKTTETGETISLASTTPTDQELFDDVITLLSSGRIQLRVGYQENDEGEFTHQCIVLTVGEIEGASTPQRLNTNLRKVTGD